MAIKNSQSKRMALANMLKQRSIYNQRMANFMSPTGAPGGLRSLTNPGNVPQNTGINQLLRPAQSSLSNIYNPSVQPTGPTGLTSNFYDPSYGIDRGFADQMTARNKAMQGMDSGQIQYDPVNKSFFSVGGMGQRGGPELQGTYDQMYHKYDINNQLRGLGTSSAGGVGGMSQGDPFNAAQIDFMNKNQDVYGPYSSPSDQNGNKLQAMKDAQVSQGGLSQLNTPNRPLRLMQGDDSSSVGGKIQQPMPSTGMPKMSDGAFVDPIRSFNKGATPALNTQSGKVNQPMPLSTFVDPIRSFNNGATPAPNTQADSLGAVALGQPTQSYPKQSQAPARRPVNRGKLNQLMPTPGV